MTSLLRRSWEQALSLQLACEVLHHCAFVNLTILLVCLPEPKINATDQIILSAETHAQPFT